MTFTSNDVARLSGATLRQLQWWDEHSMVSPTRQGHFRLYSPAEAVMIAIMSEWRRRSLTLHQVRNLLPALRTVKRFESDQFLLTDGKSLYVETASSLVERLVGLSRGVIVVAVRDHLKRLEAVKNNNGHSRLLVLTNKT